MKQIAREERMEATCLRGIVGSYWDFTMGEIDLPYMPSKREDFEAQEERQFVL